MIQILPRNTFQILDDVWCSGTSSLRVHNPSNEYELFKSVYDGSKSSLRVCVDGLEYTIENIVRDEIDDEINKAVDAKFDFILNPVVKHCETKIQTTTYTIPHTSDENIIVRKVSCVSTPSKETILDRIEYVFNSKIEIEEDYKTKTYTTKNGFRFTIYKKYMLAFNLRNDVETYTHGNINWKRKPEEVKVRRNYDEDLMRDILDILNNEEDYFIEYTIDNMKDLYPMLYADPHIAMITRDTVFQEWRDKCGNIQTYGKEPPLPRYCSIRK